MGNFKGHVARCNVNKGPDLQWFTRYHTEGQAPILIMLQLFFQGFLYLSSRISAVPT